MDEVDDKVANVSAAPNDVACFWASTELAFVNIGDDRDTPIVVVKLPIPRAEFWVADELLVESEDDKLVVATGLLDDWPIPDEAEILPTILPTLDGRAEEGWDSDWESGVEVDVDDVVRDIDATEDESLE